MDREQLVSLLTKVDKQQIQELLLLPPQQAGGGLCHESALDATQAALAAKHANETQSEAQSRLRQMNSMQVQPQVALSEVTAEFGDTEGRRLASKRAATKTFLQDVNIISHDSAEPCDKCVCGEIAKSKDLEDLEPEYDDFNYQALFESCNPVNIPWIPLPELNGGVTTTELKGASGATKTVT